jgi:hypothetical protein
MKPVLLPSRPLKLAGGFQCAPSSIAVAAWQAHLVKHPLGVDAIRRDHPWNHEGWPISDAQRRDWTTNIQALEAQHGRCGARELHGGRAPQTREKEPCYVCAPGLLSRCAGILNQADGVGAQYASATESLLEAMQEDRAIVVPRVDVSRRMSKALFSNPAWIEAGAILGVGLGKDKRPMVRIARGDGTRTDLWLNGANLNWRTTYRVPQVSVYTRWTFLLDQPAKTNALPLSDAYVVARGWWETHGS